MKCLRNLGFDCSIEAVIPGRIWIILVLLSAPCFAFASQVDPQIPPALLEELEDAHADKTTDYEQALALVQEIDPLLVGFDNPSNETWLKVRLVEALANLRLNRFETSKEQLDDLRGRISKEQFPNHWFRRESLNAALLIVSGDRSGSLKAHETLLAADLDGVEPSRVEKARINYAVVLNEVGRVGAATEIYESALINALETGKDRAVLHSGNNLIAILLDQGDLRAVRKALDELRPVVDRNPKLFGALSLRLRELELQRLEGEAQEAANGLQEFLAGEDIPPLLNASAHKTLAEAYIDLEEFALAKQHAQKAVDQLSDRANAISESRLVLATVFLRTLEYDRVLEQVEQIERSEESVPARLKLANRLKLEALLGKAGLQQEIESLEAMLAADAEDSQRISKTRSDYYEAKLTAANRSLALQKAEAETKAALEKNRNDRRFSYLVYALESVIAIIGCTAIFLYFRRKEELSRLAEQKEQNQKLALMVEDKTRELAANFRARAEMAQALERKRRVEAIGSLAGNVAHDINNLLQVISSTNEMLALPTATEEQRSKWLAISNESLRHGSGIIRHLLAFSRQQELSAHSLRFSDFIEDTKPLLLSAFGERIQLEINDESNGACVHLDASELTTSILNILSNAADAMSDGGQVTMTAQVHRIVEGQNAWNDVEVGEYLQLSFQDSGSGMGSEQLSRAFDPFYSTKSAEYGTGLGLSSVHGFIKKSGGEIRIESEINQGTLVQILLPVSAAPVPKQLQPSIASKLKNKRVLLVEDHDAVAESLVGIFHHLELNAQRVATGEEAIKMLQGQDPFDFVLTDVLMPGRIDGPALAAWMKYQANPIPVFLISGFNALPTETFDIPLLPKPFNADQLEHFLNENLASVQSG